MKKENVRCPMCGTMNYDVDLDEYEFNFNISDPIPADPSDDSKDIVFGCSSMDSSS